MAAAGATPAHAATEKITISLYRVVELSCDEEVSEPSPCPNDYYPRFEIDHQGLSDREDDRIEGVDFRTNWVHEATVDTTHNPVDIHMSLWDRDFFDDDPIQWVGQDNSLDLKFDLTTCIFTGSGLTGQQGAGAPTLAGESEGGGAFPDDSARGYFTITTPSCLAVANNTDSDGDGLMNAWEVPGLGLDQNADGTVDLPLGDLPYGAVPYRKDLFVEADYMAAVKPQADALADVVKAFADAPVDPYPDPSDATKTKFRGVNLHVTEGEAVTTVNPLMWRSNGPGTADDFNDLKSRSPPGPCTGFFGAAADRSSPNCANILSAKRQAFPTATVTPAFTYLVPCSTADGTVLTNRATVTGTDGVPDPYTDDNTARATTTVHAPVLTVDKTATATVNVGQAITYTLTYANTGSGAASGVTLPAGVYYSQALDLGSGPRPSSVTLNNDGTRTLVWNLGSLPAHSGDRQIVFTARPTLLALAGTTYTDTVSVVYKNAGGACTFAPVTDSATTTITVMPPSRDPLSQGFWKNHPELWTAEFLARVQATDQRYDTDRPKSACRPLAGTVRTRWTGR